MEWTRNDSYFVWGFVTTPPLIAILMFIIMFTSCGVQHQLTLPFPSWWNKDVNLYKVIIQSLPSSIVRPNGVQYMASWTCDFWKKIKKNPIAKYRTNRIFKGVPGHFGRRNNFQRLVGNIEEDDIEEDDFEKDTNFRSGRHQSHSVSNVKTWTTSLNKLTKFTNFHQLSYSFDGFGLLT